VYNVEHGWCNLHYSRWLRYGDPTGGRTHISREGPCMVDGCDQRRAARGWCRLHYDRWRRSGDPTVGPVWRTGCAVDGCDQPHNARGWCVMHYYRWRRHGDPNTVFINRGPCSVEGCDRKHSGRGWCSMHHRRWLKYGDPLAPVKPAVEALARSNEQRTIVAGERRAALAQTYNTEGAVGYRASWANALRLQAAHPDMSLAQLGALCDPPITKDAYAGQLRRALEHA
jgi:hypothetical protein